MKWIELNIKCRNNSDKVAELIEMGIEAEETLEFRPLYINTDYIAGIYPNTDDGCFMFVNGDELVVRESYAEVKKLISV